MSYLILHMQRQIELIFRNAFILEAFIEDGECGIKPFGIPQRWRKRGYDRRENE